MIDQLIAIARLAKRLESAARYAVRTYPWATAWVDDYLGSTTVWIGPYNDKET